MKLIKFWFSSYSESSSIHCVKYLSIQRSKTERWLRRREWSVLRVKKNHFRAFWMLLMGFTLGAFCVLMFKTTSKFHDDKIILDLSSHEVSVGEIPFPAVTVCPQILNARKHLNIDKSVFNPSDHEWADSERNLHLKIHICQLKLMTIFSESFLKFYNFINQNRSESISTLLDRSRNTKHFMSMVAGYWKRNWSPKFQTILTKWGFCYSFNMLPLPDLIHLEKWVELDVG